MASTKRDVSEVGRRPEAHLAFRPPVESAWRPRAIGDFKPLGFHRVSFERDLLPSAFGLTSGTL